MGPTDLVKLITDNSAVIGAHWQLFAALGIGCLVVGFVAGRFMFGERIETLNSRIANRDEKMSVVR
jgi:hypothetical protein